MLLSEALNDWRQKKTKEKYGVAVFRAVGSSLILTDRQLERLVDCGHYGKITNLEQLRKELDWVLSDDLGLEVVKIIIDTIPISQVQERRRQQRVASRRSRASRRTPLAANTRILNTNDDTRVGPSTQVVRIFCYRLPFRETHRLLISPAVCVFVLQQSVVAPVHNGEFEQPRPNNASYNTGVVFPEEEAMLCLSPRGSY